jgi:hypothetical protein
MPLMNVVVAAVVVAALQQSPVTSREPDFNKMTAEQIKAGIEARHPAAYYVLASKLFQAGSRDEAVFWFYAGQLRYRFHLAANPTLPPSGDPALFASLSEVVGGPINEYAFGDIDAATATMDKVLEWDEKTGNGFTSKKTHAAPWKQMREGLGKLRDYARTNADQMRAQRKQNGLENRTPK